MGNIARVCLVGAKGKMGTILYELMQEDSDILLHIQIDPHFNRVEGLKQSITQIEADEWGLVNVVVNFTTPEATMESAIWCAEHSVPLVTRDNRLKRRAEKRTGAFGGKKSSDCF